MKVLILLVMMVTMSMAVDGGPGLVIGYTISIVGVVLLVVIAQTISMQMLLGYNKRESKTFWTLFWQIFVALFISIGLGNIVGQILQNSVLPSSYMFSLFVLSISIFLAGMVSKFIKDKEGKPIGFIIGTLSTLLSMVTITAIVLSFSMKY
ncbi:MAG: hypothetical protein FAF03_06330 [Epsilonproteobacteria bacterium]|nr:hypothetical protein [Campylobacterota bacterium]